MFFGVPLINAKRGWQDIISLVFVVVPIIIFVMIVYVLKEGVTVSNLRSLYLYLVSFVSLMMILIGLIFTVQNLMDVIFPTDYYYDTIPEKSEAITEEDRRIYEENQRKNHENRRTEKKKDVAKSIAVVVVALPTFFYHWRKIEIEKTEK